MNTNDFDNRFRKECKKAEYAAKLKGVSANFLEQQEFEKAVVNGEFKLRDGEVNFAIVGKGIQYALGMDPSNLFEPLQLHYVRDAPSGACS